VLGQERVERMLKWDPGTGTKDGIRQDWSKLVCPFPVTQHLARHSRDTSKPMHKPLQMGKSRRTKATGQAF